MCVHNVTGFALQVPEVAYTRAGQQGGRDTEVTETETETEAETEAETEVLGALPAACHPLCVAFVPIASVSTPF